MSYRELVDNFNTRSRWWWTSARSNEIWSYIALLTGAVLLVSPIPWLLSQRAESSASVTSDLPLALAELNCFGFDLALMLALALSLLSANSKSLTVCVGGKRAASHLGHSNKSPCASLTDRLLMFWGHGPLGNPSHRGIIGWGVATKRTSIGYPKLNRCSQQI